MDNKEQYYTHYISKLTKTQNIDNISRTKACQRFYLEYPEIKWSLLASIVSRNAGWNITDLFLPSSQVLLGKRERTELFMTYERANWLIFSDAFPQLLIYKLSKELNQPLFHLLTSFHVSHFMIEEWHRFWKKNDKERLMIALIINEQNLIQQPVIKQSFFKKNIFHRLPYLMQNYLLMSAVLLPTHSGEIYGIPVYRFTNLTKRITIGKHTASILFSKDLYPNILHFLTTVEHTGSRFDYERFLGFSLPKSPVLRLAVLVVSHKDIIRTDWHKYRGTPVKWFQRSSTNFNKEIGRSFYLKREMMSLYAKYKNKLT